MSKETEGGYDPDTIDQYCKFFRKNLSETDLRKLVVACMTVGYTMFSGKPAAEPDTSSTGEDEDPTNEEDLVPTYGMDSKGPRVTQQAMDEFRRRHGLTPPNNRHRVGWK